MEAIQTQPNANEKKLQPPANKSHAPAWSVILLLLTIMPVGLYLMSREEHYHSWFPILLWVPVLLWVPAGLYLPSFFILGIFVLPQLTTIYSNLNFSYFSIASVFFVYSVGVFILIGQVIYGFVLQRKLASMNSLSKKLLWLTLAWPIMDLIILIFAIGCSIELIYKISYSFK